MLSKNPLYVCIVVMLISNNTSARSINDFDIDGDGKVSRQEFIDNAPSQMRDPAYIFNKIDKNDDGYISQEESSDSPKRPTWGKQ